MYIYTIEYYSAMRKKETLPFATTEIKHEGIMLSEIIQTEKDRYCMISCIGGIKKSQTQKQRAEW